MIALAEAMLVLAGIALACETLVIDSQVRVITVGACFGLYGYWRITGLPDARPWW